MGSSERVNRRKKAVTSSECANAVPAKLGPLSENCAVLWLVLVAMYGLVAGDSDGIGEVMPPESEI